MKTISVKVQSDHLESIAKVRKPLIAVAELIWNGLDADATEVTIEFVSNSMGGLEAIRVTDNGHGLRYDDAEAAFEKLGGSWKKGEPRSKEKKRILHGKHGKGRFRAFALGNKVSWLTRCRDNSGISEFRITGSRDQLGEFHIGDQHKSKAKSTGTVVEVTESPNNLPILTRPEAVQEVTEHFALYMRQFPDVSITYNSTRIDPSAVEDLVQDYALAEVQAQDGKKYDASLTVIEWTTAAERALFLCNKDGFALAEVPPGIQAPRFNFTAYLKSDLLRILDDQGALVLEDLNPDLRLLLEAAKEKLREHFRKRSSEEAAELIEEWKEQNLYPYKGEPKNIVEESERQVFDVFALNVNAYLPSFGDSDVKNKRLAFGLIKEALESNPSSLRTILEDVLGLPKDKQEELAKLLEKTTLSSIITASKVVADRLDFIKGLEVLVFSPESREVLLERSQLHRILVDHTWLFGESFNLTVDDQSLTEVLKKHLKLLGRSELSADDPVMREDGTVGIVDLMLSRRVPGPRAEEREHLVVELKRPNVPIDSEAATQIKTYAHAVVRDERFKDTKTRWTFLGVSNEITGDVQMEASQRNRR